MTGEARDQAGIDWLADKIRPDEATAKANGHATTLPGGSSSHSDDAVIEKCRAAKDAPKFEALFDRGDTHGYDSASDADYALLGILKFWTQDPDQLDRLMRLSRLARRKWDEGRAGPSWLRYSIENTLKDVGEAYDWPRERERAQPVKTQVSPASPPYIGRDTGDTTELRLIRFSERPPPPPREFVVADLIPRHHATTLYGWSGTAKSIIAILLSMSVSGGRGEFFGRGIAVYGPVLYLDFELDADEQHRRVMQIAEGMKTEVPEDLLYASTLGVRTHEAIEFAQKACADNGVVMVVLDSLGPAMVGDMAAARDVIEFHNHYIAPFKAAGVTPLLIDHQARQQAGEGYQSKGAFGSAYKEHLSRSLIQVEAGDRSAESGTLNVRLRHKKANFGPLVDPFDVSLSFSEEKIVATTRELTPADLAQEATLNAEERVLAALADGPAYADEIAEATGLARKTVKNKITALKNAGRIEATGERRPGGAGVPSVPTY